MYRLEFMGEVEWANCLIYKKKTSKTWFSRRNPIQNCRRFIDHEMIMGIFLICQDGTSLIERCFLFPAGEMIETKTLLFFQEANGDEKGNQNQRVDSQTVWNQPRAQNMSVQDAFETDVMVSQYINILHGKKHFRTNPCPTFLWKDMYFLLFQHNMWWWPYVLIINV